MSTEEDFENFNLEEIDDYSPFKSVMQDYSYDQTLASSSTNNYDSGYYSVLRNDENEPNNMYAIYEPSSMGSDATSTVDLFSSDPTSTAVLPSSRVSPAVSSPIKQILHVRIKEKMRAEGRLETSSIVLPQDSSVNQLTPEEEKRKTEKQQRNKESARKSREKKKEEEAQILRKHENLTVRNAELKLKVAHIRNIHEKLEQFVSNHPCAISSQQDNGDKMCVETGGNKVWDDKDLVSNLVDMNIYDLKTKWPFSQGSKSQRVSAIVSHLQDDYTSEFVPSGAVYDGKIFINARAGYNIGIQENVLPDSLKNVANNDKFQTRTDFFADTFLAGSEEVGSETEMSTENVGTNQFMPQGMLPVTGMITQTNSSSVSSMNISTSKFISVWTTNEDYQSEADEALSYVRGIRPPPEKKMRLE